MAQQGEGIKICISGLTACGKTTLGRALAGIYNCEHVSFSEFLLSYFAKEKPRLLPQHSREDHYWFYANDLNIYRTKSDEDKKLDLLFRKLIDSKKNIIFDSFVYPKIASKNERKTFCVLLDINKKTRVERAFRSSNSLSKKKLESYIKQKDAITNYLTKKNWDLDILHKSYWKCFDLVLDDSSLETDGIVFNQRLRIKKEIVLSFASLFLCRYYKNNKKMDVQKIKRKCVLLLNKYHPVIIKKYPEELLAI